VRPRLGQITGKGRGLRNDFYRFTPTGTSVIGLIPLRNGGLHEKKVRVWRGSGHGPWGICMSPGTGMVLNQMVLGRQASVDVCKLQP
jgi:glycine/D-amino acid oxidase-like deaminating enzyme